MLKILEKLLGAGKISEEVAKEIDTDLSGELKKLRDESAKWRTKYNELNSTYEEVVSSKSKLEEQVKNIDEKIKKAKDEGKKELVTELEKEKQEKSELMQKLNELENTTKTLKIENALSKVLATYEVLDNEIVSDVLKSKLQVVENEIKFDDGLPLEEGVKKFFESKPHLLKPKGNEGSGAGSSGSGYDENTLTAKLLSKMKG